MQVRQQHLEYEHARRIEHAISSRMAPNRRRHWLRAAFAGWTRVCEEERGRERDLELRLTCLRQLRVEFSKFDELSKANAFYPWVAEREKGRERERELDHRLKLLVGRFQDAVKAAGQSLVLAKSLVLGGAVRVFYQFLRGSLPAMERGD
jgi:hypothetical protein